MMIDEAPPQRRWHWWLLLLLVGLLAFGFRFYYVTHAQVLQPANLQNVRGDAVDYYRYARNLAQHGVFSMAPAGAAQLSGDSFRDPGYPLFLAAWMKVFSQWHSWYAAVLISQALLGALTVVVVTALARHWMSLPWLAAAGVLMAVWPHSVAMCSFLLTETLFGFLLALGLLLLRVALDRRSVGWAVASGLVFSLGALTNAVLLPLAPLLALYHLWRRKVSARMFAGLLLGGLMLTGAWSIRNLTLPATAPSSHGRALDNLVQGSWPSYHEAYQAAAKGERAGVIVSWAINREIVTIERHPLAGLRKMAHRMAQQPLKYIGWYLSKPALLWGWDIRIGQGDVYVYPTRHSPFKINPLYRSVEAVCRVLNPLLFALLLAGILLTLSARQWNRRGAPATALAMLFVTFVYSVLQAEPRYSVPFRGPQIILAAFALYQGVRYLAKRRSYAGERGEKGEPPLTSDS